MMNAPDNQLDESLFYERLVRSYVDTAQFVERLWLESLVETAIADKECRFLLLIAEPGAGKTALLASLAFKHRNWLRYFIRHDSQRPLSSGDARSFLFTIGHQLAAVRPSLFRPTGLELIVRQRIDQISTGGRTTGITVEDLAVSPFYQTSLKVEQDVKVLAGDMQGISIKHMVADKRFLELSNLQYLALLDPAAALLKEGSTEPIVILLDAVDELRYQPRSEDLLIWLINCSELPPNIRFVITSRPDPMLNELRQRQGKWLKEYAIEPGLREVETDLNNYAVGCVAQEPIRTALAHAQMAESDFVNRAVAKAAGNFQYLAALFRGIEQALEVEEQEILNKLLRLDDVPSGLRDLYAFFLTQLHNSTANQQIEVITDSSTATAFVSAWEGLYQPLLGVLAVSREPLKAEQISKLANPHVQERWAETALARLRPFLEPRDASYQLYHSTFGEFLTSPATRVDYPQLYLEPSEWHLRIVSHYRSSAATWQEVDWTRVDDYGLLYLSSHLFAIRNIERYETELYNLICQSFMFEKQLRFGSHQPFISDLRLAIEAAQSEEPSNIVQEMRCGLIDATISSLTAYIPVEMFSILPRLGRLEQAQEFASLIQNKARRCEAQRRIGEALKKQGEIKEAKKFLLLAKTTASELGDEYTRSTLLTSVAALLAGIGALDEALEAVASVQTERLKATGYTELVEALAEAKDIEGVKTVLSTAVSKKIYFEVRLRVDVVKALVRMDEFDWAMEQAQIPEAHWERADLLMAIAEQSALRGQKGNAVEATNRAIEAAEAMGHTVGYAGMHATSWEGAEAIGNGWTRADTLTRIATTLINLGMRELALRVAQRALAAAADSHTENQLSWSLNRLGGVLASLDAKECLVRACTLAEKIKDRYDRERALEHLAPGLSLLQGREMKSQSSWSNAGQQSKDNLVINDAQSNMQAFARAGRFEEALSAIEAVAPEADKAEALARVANDLVRAENERVIGRAFLIAEGIIDFAPRARLLNVLLSALSQEGPKDLLLSVARRAGKRDRTLILSEVAKALVEREPFDETVIAPLLSLTQSYQNVSKHDFEKTAAMAAIARAVVERGTGSMIADVTQLTCAAIQALPAPRHEEETRYKEEALSDVAEALARQGKYDESLNRTGLVTDNKQRIIALIQVCRALVQLNEKSRAIHVLAQAREAIQSIGIWSRRAELLKQLAQVSALADDQKGLKEILSETKNIAEAWHRAETLMEVAKAFDRMNRKRQAKKIAKLSVKTAQALGKCAAAAFTLSSISEALIELGEMKMAATAASQSLAAADGMTEEWVRAEAWGRAAYAMALAGTKEPVKFIVRQILKEVRKQSNDHKNVTALSFAAQALNCSVDKQMALEVANYALSFASRISDAPSRTQILDERPRMWALIAAGKTFIALGERDGVRSTLFTMKQAIRDDSFKVYALGEIATSLHQKGEHSQSLRAWKTTFDRACLAGRRDVFLTLKVGAPIIAAIDNGQTAWGLYRALLDVESWWN